MSAEDVIQDVDRSLFDYHARHRDSTWCGVEIHVPAGVPLPNACAADGKEAIWVVITQGDAQLCPECRRVNRECTGVFRP